MKKGSCAGDVANFCMVKVYENHISKKEGNPVPSRRKEARLCHNFFRIDKAAIIKNANPAHQVFPVSQ